MDASPEPRRIAHFVLGDLLGRGGMGAVYRAQDLRLRRTVALKLLPVSVIADPEHRARFLREARAAAAVVHGNIATVFEIGESDDDVFIAMEYVAGRSLREVLQAERLDLARAIRIAIEIARGLRAAHHAGVVHRDLKPENVMLGRDDEIKILDFGIARIEAAPGEASVTQQETDLLVTKQGRILGTPGYMSPEQGVGENVDRRGDLFSLGVVLYEMVSGENPFIGPTSIATIVATVHDPHPPLSSHVAAVTPALDTIINRCLAKAPEDRYGDAGELLDDLRACADASTIPAASTTVRVPTSEVPRAPTNAWPARPAIVSAATHAYVEAMETWRSSSVSLARSALERAIDADPAYAAAHLRLALLLSAPQTVGEYSSAPSRAREHFKRAKHHRASLAPAELALLEATRVGFDTAVDLAELAARLAEAAARFPDDRELAYWLAVTELLREDAERVESLCDVILAIDPAFGPALALRIVVALDLRADLDAARRAADECTRILPSAGHCFNHLAELHAVTGRPDDLERTARRWISADPEHPVAYWYLAQALDMADAPIESVEEALRHSGERHARGEREEVTLVDKRSLAASHGDFDTAIELSLQLERTVYEKRPDTLARAENILLRAELLAEAGRDAEAVDLIEALDRRRAAWAPHPTPIAGGLLYDPALAIAAILHRAGRMPVGRRDQRRAQWLKRQLAAAPAAGSALWVQGYAQHARTPAEAAEALAALPAFLPLAPTVAIQPQLAIGRVYALAGLDDEAATVLAVPARCCARIAQPLDVISAAYMLGIVEMRRGHRREAREALGMVVDRWGHARPRSVTSELARAQLARI